MKTPLIIALLALTAASVSAALPLYEPFNYADNSALQAVWNASSSNPDYTLDTAFGNSAPSYQMPSPTANYQGRLARNFGGDYNGTDAQPLQFSYDIYLPTEGSSAIGGGWDGARHFVEIRGYSGDAYGSGDNESILSLGLYNSSSDAHSNLYFQARVRYSWYTLDTNGGTPQRATGWHNLLAEINSTTIDFYVDGFLAESVAKPNAFGYDCVILGSDLTANGHTVWADNVSVQVIPEPATFALLGLATLLCRRKKR